MAYFEENRVKALDMSVAQAIKNIQQPGRGSGDFAANMNNTNNDAIKV